MREMAKYICNAFSLQMLSADAELSVRSVSLEEARTLSATAESAVGHADTAAVFGSMLKRPVPMNRVNVTLAAGDTILVGQVVGGRLPEGATTLPDGFAIRWMLVSVH